MPVLGIDIGGSGIKGAPVDLAAGRLAAERFRIETPRPAEPDAVVAAVAEVAAHFDWRDGVLGLTFPGVVQNGEVRTAPNLDGSWAGTRLAETIADRVGVPTTALNDADAAGVAEARYGVGKDVCGVVLMLTFGTGIGSALFVDGRLVPNTELGHLQMDGKDAEKVAAESVREAKGWSWDKWAKHVNDYLAMVEMLFSPDLLVIGGGIAKKPEKWLHLFKSRAPLKPAALGNEAGIVGAAMTADAVATETV